MTTNLHTLRGCLRKLNAGCSSGAQLSCCEQHDQSPHWLLHQRRPWLQKKCPIHM